MELGGERKKKGKEEEEKEEKVSRLKISLDCFCPVVRHELNEGLLIKARNSDRVCWSAAAE